MTQLLSGAAAGRLNGCYVLTAATVLDDAAADTLFGDGGLDWFFAHLTGPNSDTIKDWTSGKGITSLQKAGGGGARKPICLRRTDFWVLPGRAAARLYGTGGLRPEPRPGRDGVL